LCHQGCGSGIDDTTSMDEAVKK